MSTQTHCLVEAAVAATVETTNYTSTGVRTVIDSISAYAAAAATLTLKIVPSGGAAGAGNVLAVKSFAAGESYKFPELVGQVLEAGDFISELATGSVVRRISGRVVT